MLPVSAGLILFSAPVVRVMFERGEFDPAATTAVATCLAAYAVGLVPMAAYYVVTRTYYALHDMRTPVATGAGMVGLNAVLAYVLMRAFGVAGIAMATTVVSFVNVGLLLWLLGRSLHQLDVRPLLSDLLRTGAACAVAMGVWALVMRMSLPVAIGRFDEALRLLTAGAAAAAVYLGACVALRVEGVGLLRSMLRRSS
jgi:putative peptidoglycan lipid II flippase